MKKWIVAILAIASLIIILFAGILTYMGLVGRDIPPPDTSDLVLERPQVAPDENAYPCFAAVTNHLVAPTNHSILHFDLCATNPPTPYVREIVARNDEAFAMIDKGLERTTCLTPEVNDYMDSVGPIVKWLKAGRLLRLKAQLELLDGQNSQAAETAVSLVRFGSLIQQDASTLICYLVGVAILDMGLTEVQAISRDDGTSGEVLERLSNAIAKIENLSRGLERGMKAEYKLADSAINDLAEGEADDFSSFVGMDSMSFLKGKKIPTYFFQPNKTRSILANVYRGIISNAVQPYAAMELNFLETNYGSHQSKLKLIMRPNMLGKILTSIIFPAFENILQRHCRTECTLAATKIIVALHASRKAHGQFPAKLDKLVPTYLEEIPRDPFDGEQFRYNRSKGIIYSVGQDTQDSGGSEQLPDHPTDNRWDAKDAVFKIEN